MNALPTMPIPEADRLVLLRDAAAASAVSERTLLSRLRQHGIGIVSVSPHRRGIRYADYQKLLAACSS